MVEKSSGARKCRGAMESMESDETATKRVLTYIYKKENALIFIKAFFIIRLSGRMVIMGEWLFAPTGKR